MVTISGPDLGVLKQGKLDKHSSGEIYSKKVNEDKQIKVSLNRQVSLDCFGRTGIN